MSLRDYPTFQYYDIESYHNCGFPSLARGEQQRIHAVGVQLPYNESSTRPTVTSLL